jgi:hypothetical protein
MGKIAVFIEKSYCPMRDNSGRMTILSRFGWKVYIPTCTAFTFFLELKIAENLFGN